MAEGGVNEGVAVLAEGGAVYQTIERGNINVVGGDQVNGSPENINNGRGIDKNRRGTAMLAEGEHVDQQFTQCDINVVAGDQIHGNVTYNIIRGNPGIDSDARSSTRYGKPGPTTPQTSQNDGIASIQKGKIIKNPKNNSRSVRWKEKLTGKNFARFVKKINEFSLGNIQGKVTQNYDELSEPVNEYYPQMKTGFKLFKGDYLPQDGFSAHCKPKSGNYIDFETCAKIVAETRNQPCVIIGQPGSGKTITMKRLAKTFIAADQFQSDQSPQKSRIRFKRSQSGGEGYDVVLHMNIRDIPNTDSGTLAEVIFSPCITKLTDFEAQYGLQSILKMKTKIIMFFDGLDQASWEPNCDKIIGPWETASTATIFGNILAGHLLSDVPITVSSREHSIAGLSQNIRPKFIAALVGFRDNDAKALYCEIMGEGADDDWNAMRISNPALHYMCLTPVFLIFYMITRKANPKDPPDCATGVMVCIIQIFLECENARKIDRNTKITELLNNLKKMAFRGTKDQRVVFEEEDLKRFNLAYDVISDIIIKVPGFSNLGQKILEGMFRFFFSHQTLQEILSALRVVELDYTKFVQVVDEEFPKPYWSVVRSFTCGILKNEGIGNRISTTILKPISDLKKKCEYLMTHLRQQLLCDGSPANKLETFVALREASALNVLRGLADDLDFSNIPLTPAMINTLCSVMKYIGEVRRLSLANSGMDYELLSVFEKGTRGLGIKVAILDIRGNGAWKEWREWKAIFENITISECFMDVSGNDETETDGNVLLNIVNAASANNIGQLHLGGVKKIRLNIEQLSKLTESKFRIQLMIEELLISPTPVELNVWRQAFQQMAFDVQHCLVENPLPNPEGEVDVDLWIAVLEAALCARYVRKVSLTSERISMTIGQVESINQSKIGGEIDKLYIRAEGKSIQADVWRQIFQEMTFAVQHCFVESPLPNEKGKVDIPAWIDAFEAARAGNVKKVSMTSKKNNPLTIGQVESLNHLEFGGEIDELYIRAERESIQVDVWRQIFQKMTFTVQHCFVESPPPNKEGKVDIPAWIVSLEATRVVNVKKVSLMSKEIFMTISEVESVNDSKFGGEINELYIRPDRKSFTVDIWRKTFQQMTITVQHCFVEYPKEVTVKTWIDVSQAAEVGSVKKVSLTSKEISMTMSDVEFINNSGFCGEIYSLSLLELNLSGENWRQLGEVTRKFNVTELNPFPLSDIPDVRSFVKGHGNAKVKKIIILPLQNLCRSSVNAKSDTVPGQVKLFAIRLPIVLLDKRAEDVGRLISELDPDDNEMVMPFRSLISIRRLDVDGLASGLNGFKIKELVLVSLTTDDLVDLVRKCNVENLFLREDCDVDLDEIRGLTNVTVLSYEEFNERLEIARR